MDPEFSLRSHFGEVGSRLRPASAGQASSGWQKLYCDPYLYGKRSFTFCQGLKTIKIQQLSTAQRYPCYLPSPALPKSDQDFL